MDADTLVRFRCLFGGGTAISLSHDEFRESVDIDFICSFVDGYRELRNAINGNDLGPLMAQSMPLLRQPRVDQYGIRCAFLVDEVAVKFEIVFEGRIELDPPMESERICGIWTLSPADRVATKLMANADRWADDAVMSRDLIDLAMSSADGQLDAQGVAKAERAYGRSIADAFAKAKTGLLERPGRLKRCMQALKMELPEKSLRQRIERLALP
ncbi:nucleotidyl transferase AbiEii/AbiGii toxin family protein [Piscinibacter terrae]|uniref:nucleotidyl transferase AbiEii/AbiGii toxin family protein n=1 Tax=Piscinibacter terrae TaxID=2496871 RepID=UPI001F331FDA|nr:nucleotidyl transferase AbiEii/AbiGii toxin family protein [Albitalea terrae]